MLTISASHAGKELYRFMNKTSVEETLYLNSVPGFTEELIKRRDADDSEFIVEEDMNW